MGKEEIDVYQLELRKGQFLHLHRLIVGGHPRVPRVTTSGSNVSTTIDNGCKVGCVFTCVCITKERMNLVDFLSTKHGTHTVSMFHAFFGHCLC